MTKRMPASNLAGPSHRPSSQDTEGTTSTWGYFAIYAALSSSTINHQYHSTLFTPSAHSLAPSDSNQPTGRLHTMQYVRNISDSVSTAWNSINPATLSGAIDVIVVEQPDGTLLCSPFHVRFGKFSLLRPYEKKVEFRVNGRKQDYAMKLGEGGEAFFVLETSDAIPQSLQTSPLVSPASSPPLPPGRAATTSVLQEPPLLQLDDNNDRGKERSPSPARPPPTALYSSSVPRDAGSCPCFEPYRCLQLTQGRSDHTSIDHYLVLARETQIGRLFWFWTASQRGCITSVGTQEDQRA